MTKLKRIETNKRIHIKIIKGSELATYIEDSLKDKFWSPEQIA
jgi:hypothetical protein